ncbi:phosphoesterase [Candidatus Woesearchaeota archaeon]|nr:phosphoesterase [Candidatus Woesearchaeota archaeon]
MKITPKIKIIDLALYIPSCKTLVITDSHIGYEEALNKKGILIPRFQFKDIIKRLQKIFKKISPETIIINGDIKHEFGTISEQEWRHTLRLIDFLKRNCKDLVLIKGNHDTVLGPIARKRNVKIVDNMIVDSILITHGHNIPEIPKKIKTIIIGHEHPAVSFKQRPGDKFKCFLKGRYKRKTLIVQPSFNLVVEGTDVTREKLLSPFLKDISNFELFIVGDKVYDFGKIKNI